MKRHGYVSATPVHLPPLSAPEQGSLQARLQDARRLVLSDAFSPTVRAAAVEGAEAWGKTPIDDNPYLAGSVEAAAWLLGWWNRERDEEHR